MPNMDGLYEIHQYDIPYDYGEDIFLGIASDIHFDSPQHDRQGFIEYLQRLQKRKAYLILNGDSIDGMSGSERKAYIDQFHDSTEFNIEAMYRQYVEDLAKLIDKYVGKDKVIGVGGGNHYFMFRDGTTSETLLAHKLNTKYLGTMSLTRIRFSNRKKDRGNVVQDICMHHGLGGGRTAGASINKLNMMATYFDADVLVQGHDHNRIVDYVNRIGLNHVGKFVNKKIMCLRSGCFLKGYSQSKASYSVTGMYPPTDIGGVIVKFTLKRSSTTVDGVRIRENIVVHKEATI